MASSQALFLQAVVAAAVAALAAHSSRQGSRNRYPSSLQHYQRNLWSRRALDPAVLKVVIGSLPATYGDFPQSDDVAPSAIFIACFSLLALAYYYIFIRDYKRGHRFWAFFGLGGYCVLKVIGFGLRINWST